MRSHPAVARPRGTDTALRAAVTLTVLLASLFAAVPARALGQLPDSTWKVRGKVFALTEGTSGGTPYVYVGGKFSRVRPPGKGHPFVTSSLARFTLDGVGDPTFAPIVSKDELGTKPATVLAVALSADGSVLYLGGKFSYVNGVAHKDIAAVSTVDGQLVPGFDATPSNNVNTILPEAGGTRIFIGGSFKLIDGHTARRLAALDAASGVPDPAWAPDADSTVRRLVYARDGTTILASGHFTTVDGQARQSIVRLNLDGTVNDWQAQPGVIPSPMTCWDVAPTDTAVLLGCGAGPNFAAAFDASSGAKLWKRGTPGNVEAVVPTPDGTGALIGGHFGTNHKTRSICGDTMEVHGLTELSADTGRYQCWAPHLYPDQHNAKGAWTLLVDSLGRLWVGGWFKQICFPDDADPANCTPQQSLARFTI